MIYKKAKEGNKKKGRGRESLIIKGTKMGTKMAIFSVVV